jgi:hypothetical protein
LPLRLAGGGAGEGMALLREWCAAFVGGTDLVGVALATYGDLTGGDESAVVLGVGVILRRGGDEVWRWCLG